MRTTTTRDRLQPAVRGRAMVAVLALLAALGLASPAVGSSYTIQARNYEFVAPGGGSSLAVDVGAQVTWVASGEPHTVTSGHPGAADNRFVDHPAGDGLLTAGDTFTTTFTTPGTFPYFCEIHPEQMSGVITVLATATSPPTPTPTKAPTPRPTASRTPSPSATGTATVAAPPTASPSPDPTPSPSDSTPGAAPASPPSTPSAAATSTAPISTGSGSSADATADPVDPATDGAASSVGPTTIALAAVGIVGVAGLALLVRQWRRRST